MGDFVLDTNKQCFLCLEGTLGQYPSPVKQESEPCTNSSPLLHSLQYLSRYLKLDIGRVFNEESQVSRQLLAKVKKARLKVELCAECTNLNEKLSKLWRKLEKIEMEIGSCVGSIHSKLKPVREAKNKSSSLRLGASHDTKGTKDEGDLVKGKLQIVEVLRSEILEKCSHKIATVYSLPRVKVKRMTMNQVDSKHSKIKLSSNARYKNSRRQKIFPSHTASVLPIGQSQLKIEASEPEPDDPLQDDDMRNTYFAEDDYDLPNEDDDSASQQVASSSLVNLGSKRVKRFCLQGTFTIQSGQYKCNACPNKYLNYSAVAKHYRRKHAKVEYKCAHCGKVFGYVDSLTRHNKSVHGGTRFKCGECSYVTTQKCHLNTHIKSIHFRQKVKCQYCSEWFSSDNSLRAHTRLNRCSAKK